MQPSEGVTFVWVFHDYHTSRATTHPPSSRLDSSTIHLQLRRLSVVSTTTAAASAASTSAEELLPELLDFLLELTDDLLVDILIALDGVLDALRAVRVSARRGVSRHGLPRRLVNFRYSILRLYIVCR